jgi:transposase
MSESKKKRNVHLPEFKAKVGLEALGGMKTVSQIAQEHAVHPMQVGQWKREIQAQARSLFDSKRGPRPVSAESAPDTYDSSVGRAASTAGITARKCSMKCCVDGPRTRSRR